METFLSRPYVTFWHKDDVDRTLEALKNLKNSNTFCFVHRWIKKDGSILYLEWNTRRFNNEGISYGVARSITKEQFEAKLSESPIYE